MTAPRIGKPVSLRGIVKNYGALRVLHDVSLEVEAGEFCTLLGASGSGKTTLLKIIAGFEPFEGGRLMVDGRDLGGVPVSKRNIGMVFQNYALFPHMNVRRNVAFGLEMRRLNRAEVDRRVEEALSLVDLSDHGDRLPRQLSGGQQQRVALARALVIRPDILLMDEPLGALDKNLRQSIQLQLKALHRRIGVTVIYVTHDQEEALHLSDRIVVMDGGRIVQRGSPQELYFHPANRFVASFLGECNFLPDGRNGCIGVRPEHLRIGSRAAHCGGSFEATLTDIVFIGTGFKLVMARGSQTLTALIGTEQAGELPEIGRLVPVSYRHGDALALAP
jgi:ABC-type Fe3+/spermidine/putrescine transport system ATPase subunit